MNIARKMARLFVVAMLGTSMMANAGWLSSVTPAAGALFEQLGGMKTVNQMVSSFLQSSATDPALKELFAGVDTSVMVTAMSNQLCAELGGECEAPLGKRAIQKGSKTLTDQQTAALSNQFKDAVGSVTQSSLLQQAVNAAVGPDIGGIVGALISMQQQ
ncbi:MAG: hypothetical protein EP312_00070 [Gammaproteobacteria bacterium]|nr:MAG: hypothetical protein EP312_00070 [Gammaproteobacteria bacterium]